MGAKLTDSTDLMTQPIQLPDQSVYQYARKAKFHDSKAKRAWLKL